MSFRLNDEQRQAALLSEELERVKVNFAAMPTAADPGVAMELEKSRATCVDLRSQVAHLERLSQASMAQNTL